MDSQRSCQMNPFDNIVHEDPIESSRASLPVDRAGIGSHGDSRKHPQFIMESSIFKMDRKTSQGAGYPWFDKKKQKAEGKDAHFSLFLPINLQGNHISSFNKGVKTINQFLTLIMKNK